MHDYDWLHQQNQQAWKAKIRQLRSELVEERSKLQPPHSLGLKLTPIPSSEQHNSVQAVETSASSHHPSTTNKRIILPKRNHADIRKNGTDHYSW